MRISGLLCAAVALSVLTPIAPSRAATISAGDLMYTDLYKWQGQYGTPTWREILANFDCTEALTFYLTNVPTPPPPVGIPAAPAAVDQVGVPVDPTSPIDPIGTPGGNPPGGMIPVPESSIWAMMLIGFASFGYAGYRRSQRPVSTVARTI